MGKNKYHASSTAADDEADSDDSKGNLNDEKYSEETDDIVARNDIAENRNKVTKGLASENLANTEKGQARSKYR